jgi:hypothetical protein
LKRFAFLLAITAAPACAEPDIAILTRCLAVHVVALQIDGAEDMEQRMRSYRQTLDRVADERGLRLMANRLSLRLLVGTLHHEKTNREASIEAIRLEAEECDEWLEDNDGE